MVKPGRYERFFKKARAAATAGRHKRSLDWISRALAERPGDLDAAKGPTLRGFWTGPPCAPGLLS